MTKFTDEFIVTIRLPVSTSASIVTNLKASRKFDASATKLHSTKTTTTHSNMVANPISFL